MREQLEQRLIELKAEQESGQKMLTDLQARQEELRNTLLRISGAILVLEEELGKEAKVEAGVEVETKVETKTEVEQD